MHLRRLHISIIKTRFVSKLDRLKQITLGIFFMMAGAHAFSQIVDCYPFKEGRYRVNDTRAGGVIIADRKSDYQTESMEVLKAVVRFKISWQNDCTYTLTLDKVIRNENKVNFPPGLKIEVKIISVNGNNSYIQELSSSMYEGIYRTEVTRIP